MSLIKGENVMLYQYDGGMWKPYVCGTDCSLVTTSEFLETSITGQGIARTFKPSAWSWEGSFNGLVYLMMANTLALPDIRSLQINRTKILVRFQRTDNSSNVYLDEGYAYVASVSDSGSNNAMATFSVQLKGTGALTQIFTPTIINPNGKVKRLEFTGTGVNFFTSSIINLKDIIEVVVDGQGRSKLITTGTPLNQEVKYTSSGGSGRLDFPQIIESGTECYIEYQDI